MDSLSPAVVAIGGLVALIVLLVLFVISRISVAGPNQAFIVTGRKGKAGGGDTSGQKVVMGASVFVVPFVQKLGVMDLTSRQIGVTVPAAVSSNGIRCSLEGVAVVKVGGTEELIRAAAQRFLGQQTEIDVFTREVLAGSLRAIVGRLSVEEIIRDRAAFAAAVAEEAENSLTGQGLVLDTFQLQDIQTEGDYLADLGRPEAAQAERERRTALAEALRAEGDAEAAAILARGQAQAEAMRAKAEAYEQYGQAAVIDIVAEALPKVVAEAARPMGQIGSMTVVSTDGASSTVKSVASTVAQGSELAKSMFGLDLGTLVQRFNASGAVDVSSSDSRADDDGTPPPPP